MSFITSTSKPQTNTTPSTSVLTSTGFTLGASGAGDAAKPTGFSLTPVSGQNKPVGGFGTGFTTTPVQSTGFATGTPSTMPGSSVPAQTSAVTFGIGTPASTGATPGTSTAAVSTGFPAAVPTGFPAPAQTGSTLGFSLGGITTATTSTATTTSAFTSKPLTTGFGLGAGEAVSSTTATGTTFGTPSTMAVGPRFSLPPASTAAAPTTLTATPQTGFSVSTSTATSTGTGFTFGTGTAAATTAEFSQNKTSVASSLTTPSTQLSLGTTTTVTSSTSTFQPASMSSFEESINKWTLELEEQEKVFVNQAAKVNAWDKLLISNGEKIVTLNQEVERVKIEQQQLEHELDYVVSQQNELQDCLVPLEKELATLSVSDPEREYTYRLAEDLDTQLKRMSEDLKEIIEHLNQANRTQDSSDPIVQIGKILNAHMNSLQWIDQQTSLLNQKIQQIDQMHQNFRQENERSFSLAYN